MSQEKQPSIQKAASSLWQFSCSAAAPSGREGRPFTLLPHQRTCCREDGRFTNGGILCDTVPVQDGRHMSVGQGFCLDWPKARSEMPQYRRFVGEF